MNLPIREQILFIKGIRTKYGLSADRIADIVSQHGEYISVHSVRRIIAKDAEDKSWRLETVEPVYMALRAFCAEHDEPPQSYAFPAYTREQYEKLIEILKGNNFKLSEENQKQRNLIEKQQKIIEILWHGLTHEEEAHAAIRYYLDNQN